MTCSFQCYQGTVCVVSSIVAFSNHRYFLQGYKASPFVSLYFQKHTFLPMTSSSVSSLSSTSAFFLFWLFRALSELSPSNCIDCPSSSEDSSSSEGKHFTSLFLCSRARDRVSSACWTAFFIVGSTTLLFNFFMNDFTFLKINRVIKFLGCRDGAVVRALASHQCGPGSFPRSSVKCGLSLLVLYSAPRGFLREIPFPLSSKTKTWLDCVNC